VHPAVSILVPECCGHEYRSASGYNTLLTEGGEMEKDREGGGAEIESERDRNLGLPSPLPSL
jgi:hypothetical protein